MNKELGEKEDTEMTEVERKKLLEECEQELRECFEKIPDGIWDEPPRFQLTGEIIPEELRKARRKKNK